MGCGFVAKQTFLRVVEEQQNIGGVFEPDVVAVMSTAFDGILSDLHLVHRDDPIVAIVAKLIIELVRNGERDPERLRQQVVGQYSSRK